MKKEGYYEEIHLLNLPRSEKFFVMINATFGTC